MQSSEENQDRLGSQSFGFSGQTLEDLLQKYVEQYPRIRKIHYDGQSCIFEKDEPAYWVYFVLDGEVDLIKRLSNGKRFIVERLVAGGLLGIEALLSEDAYPSRDYSAETIAPVTAILIEREDFEALMQRPEFALKMNQLLIQLLKKSVQRTGYLLCNDAMGKVVGALNYFNQIGLQTTPNTDTTTLGITINQIASFAGIAEETVFKQMSTLRRDKVVSKGTRSRIKLQLNRLALLEA